MDDVSECVDHMSIQLVYVIINVFKCTLCIILSLYFYIVGILIVVGIGVVLGIIVGAILLSCVVVYTKRYGIL